MRTNYYLNGKKITKKKLTEMLGADRVKRITDCAKEGFREDPNEELDFFLGTKGMLNIQFS
ncbi:MAG: hypothetical protein LIO95_05015 [Clostridiales bacterium]|nr:hypothetical protein [Clostridiales bacterium]